MSLTPEREAQLRDEATHCNCSDCAEGNEKVLELLAEIERLRFEFLDYMGKH